MAMQAPKGTKDVTPKESYKWQYIERLARELCEDFGFYETRTPVIEHTELFLRGVGDTTDIVQKEMYTFLDKGERSITLKPEGTAGAARMFLENGLFNDAQPTKMYYLYCPVFRYDKPQAGRLREHHQFGVEIYGAPRASADAECIRLAHTLLARAGVQGLSVRINSIGCPDCRPQYNDKLRAYLHSRYDGLCETCKSRFEKNPLRILDCKEDGCKAISAGAPTILDCLCGECEAHFAELKTCLTALDIPYEVDPFIVRGLDYYTKTVFEIVACGNAYNGTVCGGGRYDGLIEQLGGPKLCGTGFGMGMERLLLIAEQSGANIPEPKPVKVYIAALGDAPRAAGFRLADELRQSGIKTEFDHVGRSFKAQFKFADKLHARFVAILGEDELERGSVKLKNMGTGEELLLPLADLAQAVRAAGIQ
ncbi:MAG: histidine--tRNA ligase [Christensenellaceae bacterium]|nr:histidine--tRNA ligase [Christensenellaceae bacterium]